MSDYDRQSAKMIAELALDTADKGYEWKQRALDLDAKLRALIARIEGPFGWASATNAQGQRLKDEPAYLAAYLAVRR